MWRILETVISRVQKFIGKLRISTVNKMEFMPFDTQNKSDDCFIPAKQMPQFQCFVGGIDIIQILIIKQK
jgi:hypothetical protein